MNNQMVKIRVPLPPGDASGVDAEWLWAEAKNENQFIIQNVPIRIYGLSLGDTVAARLEDDVLVFDEVVERGGHSTYRIYANEDTVSPELERLFITLRSLKCEFERANKKIVGIDVLPEADVYAVYCALEGGEDSGIMEFEEGHCGHPLRSES